MELCVLFLVHAGNSLFSSRAYKPTARWKERSGRPGASRILCPQDQDAWGCAGQMLPKYQLCLHRNKLRLNLLLKNGPVTWGENGAQSTAFARKLSDIWGQGSGQGCRSGFVTWWWCARVGTGLRIILILRVVLGATANVSHLNDMLLYKQAW